MTTEEAVQNSAEKIVKNEPEEPYSDVLGSQKTGE